MGKVQDGKSMDGKSYGWESYGWEKFRTGKVWTGKCSGREKYGWEMFKVGNVQEWEMFKRIVIQLQVKVQDGKSSKQCIISYPLFGSIGGRGRAVLVP